MTVPSGPDPIVVERLPVPPAPAALAGLARDRVLLTAQERGWARRRVTTESGRVLVLALPPGTVLAPGAVLHVGPGWYALLEAAREPVLVIAPRSREERIRVALEVGGQHGVLGVDGEDLLVPDEPAMERLLRRLEVPWTRARRPFRPVSVGTPH